jgi:four helix bundle protein
MSDIKTFRDLYVWQGAHELTLNIYKVTKLFPKEEKYALVSQIRRAAVSVASNIVEGFHRKSLGETMRFYRYSEASLEEVKYQLLVAKDLQYIDEEIYHHIIELTNEVGKMLNGWMKAQK